MFAVCRAGCSRPVGRRSSAQRPAAHRPSCGPRPIRRLRAPAGGDARTTAPLRPGGAARTEEAGPVDITALPTRLEALELTADQLSCLGRTGQRLRKDSNQRASGRGQQRAACAGHLHCRPVHPAVTPAARRRARSQPRTRPTTVTDTSGPAGSGGTGDEVAGPAAGTRPESRPRNRRAAVKVG